jgi:hypothetical protein
VAVEIEPLAGTPTPRLSLPVPAESDPADVPADIGRLATALDGAALVTQGTLAQRPAAAIPGRMHFVQGDAAPGNNGVLWWDTGTAWLAVNAARGTTLPTSPADGQEFVYTADATNGVEWRLKYNASSASAHKWEFIGGTPLSQFIITQELVAQTGWTNPATPGPTVTPPIAGDYMVRLGIGFTQGGNTAEGQPQASVGVGGALPTSAAPIVQNQAPAPGASANYFTLGLTDKRLMLNLTAGNALTVLYRDPGITTGNGGFYCLNRYLEAVPVRLG